MSLVWSNERQKAVSLAEEILAIIPVETTYKIPDLTMDGIKSRFEVKKIWGRKRKKALNLVWPKRDHVPESAIYT